MASPGGGPPQLGATFIPGGFDDFYMPVSEDVSVVSPAPQRINPEMPENIQQNLANLDLNDNASQRSGGVAVSPMASAHSTPLAPQSTHNSNRNSYMSFSQPLSQPGQSAGSNYDYAALPNFSPFPAITSKPNVPPTDEEKEQILENARMPVLNSNDPDMQLAWGQDVLAYIATSQLYEERIAVHQPKRAVTPNVEHQLRVDAMNIVNFLADQHHPKAEFMKGMWLEFGNFGVRQDKREAFRCYMRAAEQGYSRAEYRMGMQFEQGNDPMKALLHYRRGAEAGDSASNYRLGMMTLMGQMGQQQDYAKGIAMLRVAAEHADENAPQGAYVLGMLQIRELPQVQIPEVLLPYDEAAGRLNIEKAAYLGFAKAQLKMGAAYELCAMGCEFDPASSLHYNSLAARQGEPEAEMAISKWFLCGYDGIFQKNEELAYTYAERAAQSALPTAEFAMGYFNEIGMHVPVNINLAKEWYEKAAKSGNADAQQRIESLDQEQALSKKDHEQVAINKIRSQYGSKRGQRPDRFKTKGPDLPTISDGGDDWSNSAPQSRSGSTVPYPEGPRPGSAAPYPMNNGPPPGPQPAGGFFAAPQDAGRLGPQYGGQQRPPTTPNDPRQRIPSGGPPQGQWGRGQGPPQGYNQGPPQGNYGYGQDPRANSVSPRPGAGRMGHSNPHSPVQPEIGYVAPLAPRKQGPPQGYGPGPGPQPQRPGHQQGYGQPQANRPPQGMPPQGMPPQQRIPSNRMQGPGGPGGQGQRPPPQRQHQQPQQRPQKPGGPGKPQAQVGNGPKTFAEMGIPNQKQGEDCIIM